MDTLEFERNVKGKWKILDKKNIKSCNVNEIQPIPEKKKEQMIKEKMKKYMINVLIFSCMCMGILFLIKINKQKKNT